MPDTSVAFAILHLSWEQSDTLLSETFPWQPGDSAVVACGDELSPRHDLSYALTGFGDTIGVIWDSQEESLTYYFTYPEVNDPARYVLHYEEEDQTYTPTGFSPNGEGINESFYPMGSACVRELNYFGVFDRWGVLLFEKRAFQAGDPLTGWDGTHNQRPVNPGTYVWKMVVTYYSGLAEERSGDVTLCR